MLWSGWQGCSPCLKHRSFLPRVLLSTPCVKKLRTIGDNWPQSINGLQVEKSSLSFPHFSTLSFLSPPPLSHFP